MFSLSAEDDEGGFMAPHERGSSNLASLFGHDRASFSGGNESLTYTAPKDPKKEKTAAAQSDPPAVLFATAVHTYRYVNNQHVNQGKLGAAVLGNHAAHDYKILLYASKQQQVAVAKIHSNFSFTIQASNYASFCDDQRQQWSICFDSEKNAVQFAKQVGLAIFNSSPANLCTQDLTPGDGQLVEAGDAVEVKYTGYFWTNHGFGKVFDGNMETDRTFKFKTGKGKVIKGWDQGVIGMKKNSKRFIGIPSNLAYGEKGAPPRIPPNSPLLFEVEILRIKGKEGSSSKNDSQRGSPVTVQESPPSAAPLPNITSEPSGVKPRSESSSSLSDGIKGRTASISDKLSLSPEKGSDKARLLARMSKMGKNVLTIPGAVAAEPDQEPEDDQVPFPESESSTEVSAEAPEGSPATAPSSVDPTPQPTPRTKPQLRPRPATVHPHPEVQQSMQNPHPTPNVHEVQPQVMTQPAMTPAFTPHQQVALYQPPQHQPMNMGYPMMPPGQVFATQVPAYPQAPPPPPPAPAQPSSNDAMVPVLMAESRQQQSEVRMAIGKVSDKIDELSNKIDRVQQSSGSAMAPNAMAINAFGSSGAAMDASVLLHNLTRIIQENEKLKADCSQKNSRIESLNDKISDLLQKNQSFVEQSHTMMEKRSDSLQHNATQSQSRVFSLEQEKLSMTTELTALKTKFAATEAELTSLQQQDEELKLKYKKASTEADKYRMELEHIKDTHIENEEQTGKLKKELKEEKYARKRLESKVEHVEEELTDLKHEKDSLEKNVADRKKKQAADKKKFEEELDEMRAQHEENIKELKDRHRKDKKSTGAASAEQLAELEADIDARWSEKSQKMVSQAEDRWKRKYDDLLEEKEETLTKLASLEEKHNNIRAEEESKERQLKELQDKVEELEAVRDKFSKMSASQKENDERLLDLQAKAEQLEALQEKYQDVRSKTLQMKEQYEEKLATAEQEHEVEVTKAYENGKREGGQEGARGAQPAADVSNEVKKIMNNVYHMLKSEFEAEGSYTGPEIMAVVLKAIKEITLKLVNPSAVKDNDSEEEDEEEDEEEEESEEEEDDDDEEEEEEEEDEEVEDDDGDEEEDKAKEEEKEEEVVLVVEKEAEKEKEVAEAKQEEGKEKNEEKDEDEEAIGENEEACEKESEKVEEEGGELQSENTTRNEAEPTPDTTDKEAAEAESSTTAVNEDSREDIDETKVQDVTNDADSDDAGSGEAGPPPLRTESDDEQEEERSPGDMTEPPADGQDVSQGQPPNDESAKEPEKESPSLADEKLKSLFGDDDHDDVEATFGPLTRKPKEPLVGSPPSKPVPPPLFDDDDDDDDDDIDWFK